MSDKIKMVPQWAPTKEQREWLDKESSKHGTITGLMRYLVNQAMSKKAK